MDVDIDIDAEGEVDPEFNPSPSPKSKKDSDNPKGMLFHQYQDRLIYSPMVQTDLDVLNNTPELRSDANRRPSFEPGTFLYQNFPYSGLWVEELKKLRPDVADIQLQKLDRLGCPWSYTGGPECVHPRFTKRSINGNVDAIDPIAESWDVDPPTSHKGGPIKKNENDQKSETLSMAHLLRHYATHLPVECRFYYVCMGCGLMNYRFDNAPRHAGDVFSRGEECEGVCKVSSLQSVLAVSLLVFIRLFKWLIFFGVGYRNRVMTKFRRSWQTRGRPGFVEDSSPV